MVFLTFGFFIFPGAGREPPDPPQLMEDGNILFFDKKNTHTVGLICLKGFGLCHSVGISEHMCSQHGLYKTNVHFKTVKQCGESFWRAYEIVISNCHHGNISVQK